MNEGILECVIVIVGEEIHCFLKLTCNAVSTQSLQQPAVNLLSLFYSGSVGTEHVPC